MRSRWGSTQVHKQSVVLLPSDMTDNALSAVHQDMLGFDLCYIAVRPERQHDEFVAHVSPRRI